MELKDRVILISGATGGMGQDLCAALARQGVRLGICARQTGQVTALCHVLRQTGAAVYGAAVDVTQADQVAAFVQAARQALGTPDGLVNLAGVSIPGQIVQTDPAVFDTLMNVNVKGSFLMAREFAACAPEGAQIINLGSMAARRVNGNAPLYCMAKTALNVLSEGVSLQLAQRHIRVTTLNPGGADTPFWGDRPVDRSRLLQPYDITAAVLFVLQSDPRVAIHSIDFESVGML